MVNLNWEQLRTVNVEEIGDEEVGQLYQQLVEVEVDSENDTEKLKILFHAAQAIMQAKAMQAEVALDELEQQLTKSGASKNEQILLDKIEQLNRQIKSSEYQPESARHVDNERISHLEHQVELLQNEIIGKDRQISHEKKENERYVSRIEEVERERKELSNEISHVKDEIEDYRRLLDEQNDSSYQRSTKNQDHNNTIREKNRHIGKLLEDIEHLEVQNARLQKQVVDLRDKLEDSTKQMDNATSDYIQIKNNIQQSEQLVETLRVENGDLRRQISDLMQHNQAQIAADDEIIAAVNHRVEEWKAVLSGKEAAIIKLQNEVKQLRDSIAVSSASSSKTSIAILSKGLEERDKHIKGLRQQVEVATKELDESAHIIEKLKSTKLSGSENSWQLTEIENLKRRLSQAEVINAESRQRLEEAETHAQEKDKELTEALAKISRYERGEYGLADAVQEIKDYKVQLRIRDQQIEVLNITVNEIELALDELKEVNEDLCQQLGVSPKELCHAEINERISAKRHQEKALNSVLQKEIETLEEERLLLKQDIRKLAQIVGHRASRYGLTVEDAKLLQSFAENLSSTKSPSVHIDDEATQTRSVLSDVTQQVKRLQVEVEITREKLSVMSPLPASQSQQHHELITKANNQIDELVKAFKISCGETDLESQVIVLRKLLVLVNSGSGINEQLNSLVTYQQEIESLRRQKENIEKILEETKDDNTIMHEELTMLRNKVNSLESISPGIQAPKQLLDDTNLMKKHEDEADPIFRVNSCIQHYLMRIERSSALGKANMASTEKENVISAEQLNKERDAFEEDKEAFEAEKNSNLTKLEEYQNLLDVLSKSDDGVKNELTEMSRKLTISKVNEKNLLRKCSLLVESEALLRKVVTNLRNELLAMQGAVLHRINYLEQFKNIAIFKIAALHQALDNSIPAAEYEAVDKSLIRLTANYQQMLQKNKDSLTIPMDHDTILISNHQFQTENDNLRRELHTALEKLHSLELELYRLSSKDIPSEEMPLAKQIALLEMKELNERQRADHLFCLHKEQQRSIDKLSSRVSELEEKLTRLTKLNFEQQEIERELRIDLESCVSKKEYDRVCQRLEYTEAQDILLKKEIAQLKEIVEVAENQVSSVHILQCSKIKEMELLDQRVVSMQSSSDDKTLVGKLYRQLINVQINEASMHHKLEQCNSQLHKIEALSLRLEQKCDEKDKALYHFRNEARLKIRQLKKIIRGLYHQFHGAIPLSKQEKFNEELLTIRNDRLAIQKELEDANKQRLSIEEHRQELEMKTCALQELISTLKEEQGTQQVVEWHNKIIDLRVQDMKKSHQIQKLCHDLEYKQQLVNQQEEIITALERKAMQMEMDNELLQVAWDNSEFELQRSGSILDVTHSASLPVPRVEIASSPLPDTSLPVTEQLDQALSTIKANSLTYLENLEQYKDLKKKNDIMERRIHELEILVGAQDKVIKEFRLQKLSSDNKLLNTEPTKVTSEEKVSASGPTFKIAQAMMEGLKARLFQKEETIVKYQELLKKAREDLEEMAMNHQREIVLIQAKVQAQAKNAVIQLRRELQLNLTHAQESANTSEQITKMNELQEIAVQQDMAISVLAEKLKASSKEIQHWQLKVDATAKEFFQEKERLQEEHAITVKKLEQDVDAFKNELQEKESAVQASSAELEKQIMVNKKAPSILLKNAFERLRKDMQLKERQIQSLSNALTELKGEMKSLVKEGTGEQNTEGLGQSNLQAHYQNKCKTLQGKLDAALEENGRLKKEIKKSHPNNDLLIKIKEDLDQQITISSGLQSEKQNLEGVIKDLESKIKRISRTEERDILESNLLRSKIKQLEEKLLKQNTAEKLFDKSREKQHSNHAVETWEETKKWQQTVAKLQSKLSDKESENAGLERSIVIMKNVIGKMEKEKAALERKTKFQEIAKIPTPSEGILESFGLLYNKNCALQEEVTLLKQQLFIEKDVIIDELKMENSLLTRKLKDMANRENHVSSPRKNSVALVEELTAVRLKEDSLHKEILKLSKENFELQFGLQQAKMDIPQCMDRIKHLEAYVDLLKSEQSFPTDAASSPRKSRVGTSGKSIMDLEKTIGVLKKVVEKLQSENEQLKKRIQQSSKTSQLLHEENTKLKENQNFVAGNIGLNKLPEFNEKHISKIIAHNKRLLHDLEKEVKANEALRIQLHAAKSENEKLQQLLRELEHKLEGFESRYPNLASLGGQKWKSQVATRLYEEKLAVAEKEIQSKSQIIDGLKKLAK